MAYYNDLSGKIKAGSGIIISDDDTTGAIVITSTSTGGGTVINGTPNRISITGTSELSVDIASGPNGYAGQASINTLGVITTGEWSATPVSVSSGGTGGISAVPYAVVTGGGTTTSQLQYVTQGTANQVLRCGGVGFSPYWGNESAQSATALSLLTDCSTTGVINRQLLVYATASQLNKWTPYTLSGATFDDVNKTITVSSYGSSVASALQTSGSTTVSVNGSAAPATNQALIAINSATASWQSISHLNLTSIGSNTHAQIDSFISNYNSKIGFNYYSYNFIQATAFSDFANRNYYCNSLVYNYVFDFAYIPSDSNLYFFNVPTSGLINGQQFQLQFNTSSLGKVSLFRSSSLYIYIGNQSGTAGGAAIGGNIQGNNTYIATYYTAGNNPWRFFDDVNPSWTLTPSAYGNLININSSFTFVNTVNYSTPINVVIPTPFNGQEFVFKDVNGHVNVNPIVLGAYNSNLYNVSPGSITTTATLNSTSVTSFKFIYVGLGSNGTFYSF